MRHFKFITACAAAVGVLAAGSAFAQTATPISYVVVPQAVIGGDYSYLSANGGSANIGGGEAAGIIPFGGGFSGQIGGAYHSVNFNGGGSYGDWNAGGAVAWNSNMG